MMQLTNKSRIMINALNGVFRFDVDDIVHIEKLDGTFDGKNHTQDYYILPILLKHAAEYIVMNLKVDEAETIRTLLLNECNKTARNILSHPFADEMIEANKEVA